MNYEKTFSVYLFLSYRNLSVKIADYAHQLGYTVCDGFSTPIDRIFGISVVDDQLPHKLFHKLLTQCPILVWGSSSAPPGPCELLEENLSLIDFSKILRRYHSKAQPQREIISYWLAHNPSSKEVHKRITLAATKNCSVLVQGESGTGKEVVAQAVHQYSETKGLFVAINCGAIPSDLVESELFGHEKGAFTGAVAQRLGKCEVASGGTLFLDEIGDMPLSTQVKLLRVLQELSFERIGSSKPIPFSARIISATHQSLQSLVVTKRFREDLFYRLNVLPIALPPLRDYPEEIASLIQYLISREKLSIDFDASAVTILQDYPWPGNIRQLINVLKRLDVFYGNTRIFAKEIGEILKFEPQWPTVGPSFA